MFASLSVLVRVAAGQLVTKDREPFGHTQKEP
jgi:hypothetical protein